MSHDDCTCCRHWRRFEQPSGNAADLIASRYRARVAEIVGEGPEFEEPIGLLPPRPYAPLAR